MRLITSRLDYDGGEKQKDHYLYQPGDVFIVNEGGWLIKQNKKANKVL